MADRRLLARHPLAIVGALLTTTSAVLFIALVIAVLARIVKKCVVCSDAVMSQPSIRPALYKGYRFPPETISRCVWLYYRFGVSLRDVSELMLARGIEVSHEAIRLWTQRLARSTRDD